MKTATIIPFPFHATKEGREIVGYARTTLNALGIKESVLDSCIERASEKLTAEITPKKVGYNIEGDKYAETKDLDFSEIVKMVRRQIKTEFKTSKGWKFSIKSERGRCSSINVRVLKSPLIVENPEFTKWNTENIGKPMFDAPSRYTDDFQFVYDRITDIMAAYNFDDSDSMTDYFHTRFYSHIYVDVE